VAVVERLSLWGDRGCNMTPVFFFVLFFVLFSEVFQKMLILAYINQHVSIRQKLNRNRDQQLAVRIRLVDLSDKKWGVFTSTFIGFPAFFVIV